jgi:hypothetical protein
MVGTLGTVFAARRLGWSAKGDQGLVFNSVVWMALTPGPSMVLASAASGVVDLIGNRGGDVDRIFGRANLSPETIANPRR